MSCIFSVASIFVCGIRWHIQIYNVMAVDRGLKYNVYFFVFLDLPVPILYKVMHVFFHQCLRTVTVSV